MDAAELYHFLFETMPGIAVLVGGVLVLSIVVCAVLELRTRRLFRHRPDPERDEWSLDDLDEEGDGL